MFGIRALDDITVHSICHPSVLIQKSRICDVLRASCKATKISLLAPMADTDAVEGPVVERTIYLVLLLLNLMQSLL